MNKPQERKLPQQVSPAEAPVSDKKFTPVYFRSIELVESCGHKQDAFDIEHDAWIVSMTTRPCPKDRPFGEHFLALVRDQIKVFRDEQRTLQRRSHRTEELEGHAETCIVPFVGSTASPEDLMIAHEEAQERDFENPDAGSATSSADDIPDWTEWTASPASLRDALRDQLLLLGLGERDFALANLIGGVRSSTNGALAVRAAVGDATNLAVPYPPVSPTLTAGEWNRAAIANNRIEIRSR